jgi:hypothetical protein
MAPRFSRLIGTLGALWSLVASVSPVPLHHCPGNAATALRAGGMAHEHALQHAMQMPHAAHDHMATAGTERHAPSTPSDEDCPWCRCLGCCCAAPCVGLPAPGLLVPATPDVATYRVPFAAPSVPRLDRQPHILPFGNGPPA